MDFEKDYYAILGLENTASTDEIKRTYRVLVKQYHPDVNKAPNATEIFNAITEAYEVLSDERLRAEYDAHTPSHNHARRSAAKDSGVRADRGNAARRASPAEVTRERTLLLSLIVPGLYQITSGDRKFGALALVVYIVFWGLAIIYSVEIGVLAVLIWAVALLDAYAAFRKKAAEGSEHGSRTQSG